MRYSKKCALIGLTVKCVANKVISTNDFLVRTYTTAKRRVVVVNARIDAKATKS